MTNDTEGIIARLEKATGPSDELNALILQAITPEFADTRVENGWLVGGNHAVPTLAAPFTSSIDAALTLVPEGWRWKLGYSKHVPCVAELVDYTPKAIGATCGECDSNHAIALCIAALRSRFNKGEG